ncbi:MULTISPECIES: glutathione S-transferase N-terminal domain-containing protein [unclassified Chelatococcus]|uniref:glutathione S-transferase N-terminal domain-containing protein n=1 Tax=unclassified Chelatococcus TaxID=2638111 RepID=UPI001BCE76FD|nr:glutathione S-transferase N-terminal domain-containing protein [Chelatococcus sp.]MBS7739006.1 glutathione S-transferase N-terminal domain-containing protein [Chelatococcus sp. HY11]CAH1672003.1 disulfide reductase [Hyphomicrobiales bacterium]MBX3543439.1 glutathione S-transferase N-terminal domain-containing protein [Chelatococcus sp.]MCO5076464.1 glutathione S-transferase N-terminal domain-containing protein [Chelatococcus sp.]CAH1675778.1 disulfide reductase [Hyphomicrobiales bacterium]
MIELLYWTTPNGHKIVIALEELGLPYRITPVNISTGEQFKPDFLKVSPNNRIPAIIDHAPEDGGRPLPVFESGAILEYLADKTGKLLPHGRRPRFEALQWLYWQMGGLGPMAGQAHHFLHYAPEDVAYAKDRYVKEANRLYGVLDRRLADRDFVGGDFSIADIAIYPWVRSHARHGQDLGEFPGIRRWYDALGARPSVIRTYEIADTINKAPTVSKEAHSILFGQTATSHTPRDEAAS